MNKYRYIARTDNGKLLKGVIWGENTEDCVLQLKNNKLYPIKLKVAKTIKGGIFRHSKKIKYVDISVFCLQYSALLKAGITIPQALKLLKNHKNSPQLGQIINDLIKGLEQGDTLHRSIKHHREKLPEFFLPLIKVGEMTNCLESVLENLSIYYDQRDKFKKQLIQLLTYPIILIIVMSGVLGFLFINIVPGFERIYTDLGVELPATTNCLLAISKYLRKNLKKIIPGFSIFAFFLSLVFSKDFFKKITADYVFYIPFYGRFKKIVLLERLAKTLGLLFENGLEVLEGVELAIGTSGVVADKILYQITTYLKQGTGFTLALKKTGFFPGVFIEMVSIGEETGCLDKMLKRISSLYENSYKSQIDKFIMYLEPGLMILIAILVGLIIFSVMIPMFNMVNHI